MDTNHNKELAINCMKICPLKFPNIPNIYGLCAVTSYETGNVLLVQTAPRPCPLHPEDEALA